MSLNDVLRRCVIEKLGSSGAEKHDVLQLSSHVAKVLTEELGRTVPALDFPREPELIGSMADELKVPGGSECDYLLVIQLKSSFGTMSVCKGTEGYHKLSISGSNPPGALVLSCSGMNFVSPIKVYTHLVGKVQQALDACRGKFRGNITRIMNKSNQAGPAICLQVDHTNGSFDMDFVPCFYLEGKYLVAKPHPNLGAVQTLSSGDPDTLRWRRTKGQAETMKIAPKDKGDGAWSKQVCRLVKYLRKRNPQFAAFSSYIYKTEFMHLLDEHSYPTEWREQKLAARFLDFMRKFQNDLRREELYHYFLLRDDNIRRNLLKPRYDSHRIQEVANYIGRLNQKGEEGWADLFRKL